MTDTRDLMGGLAKGLAVIEVFGAERPRLTVSEAAAGAGLDRASARRCLLTLAHYGYADYDGKFFTLTPRVLRLGIGCLAGLPLPQIVQPHLDRLSAELGESTSVSILDEDEIVYVARAAQRKLMAISLMPGSRLPACSTSMGRVLLAALPEEECRAVLLEHPPKPRTPCTITDPEALMEKIAAARLDGHALIDQEIELGLCSIAVPLHSARGRVVAALNCGMAAGPQATMRLMQEVLPRLTALAQELRGLLPR